MSPTVEKTLFKNAVEDQQSPGASLADGRLILQDGQHWHTFSRPLQVISAFQSHEVQPALMKIEEAVAQHGLYAAGFMAYEAAAGYGLAVHAAQEGSPPLLWFGLYERPETSHSRAPISSSSEAYQLGDWQMSLNEEAYRQAIERIKAHIASGDTYQVNFTMQLGTKFSGDPQGLFLDLSRAQKGGYAAYLDIGSHVICSASPELFFQLKGNQLTSRPMKGTAHRGRTLEEDVQNMVDLQNSTKNRAENVMIVDMIRNDFGRIANIGSVKVPHLFTVEKYPTLLQMTSTVTAESTAALPEIMEAMFPCASITGAPKIRTMAIIRDLELFPRGVYTGTIGYWGPGRQAQFNVAIRTVVIDRRMGTAQYGVGSGIVWDSDALAEYEECRLKTAVLTRGQPDFDLLESLLWTPETGYFLLENHLTRLQRSADYFDYPFDRLKIEAQLKAMAFDRSSPRKIRILLSNSGQITSQAVSLGGVPTIEPLRVGLALEAVNSNEIWLYHKTTRRKIYENARASRPDCDEVLLWNEHGALTESATANIVLALDGHLYTPPVSSGLLAGTFRQHLLQQGEITERELSINDLQKCSGLFLINSVRKWRRATFVESI